MIQETQASKILRHLESGKSVTPLLALGKWGCFRLGARIWNLRKDGYPIQRRMVPTPSGKHVAEYWLAS